MVQCHSLEIQRETQLPTPVTVDMNWLEPQFSTARMMGNGIPVLQFVDVGCLFHNIIVWYILFLKQLSVLLWVILPMVLLISVGLQLETQPPTPVKVDMIWLDIKFSNVRMMGLGITILQSVNVSLLSFRTHSSCSWINFVPNSSLS